MCRCTDSSFHRLWSGFFSRRGLGMEQPARLSYISSDSQHVQAAAKKTELFIRCYDLPSSYARKHSV